MRSVTDGRALSVSAVVCVHVPRRARRDFPRIVRRGVDPDVQPGLGEFPGDQAVRNLGCLYLPGDSVLPAVRCVHDHRRCGAAADRLRQCVCRTYPWRPGDCGGVGVHVVCRVVRFVTGHRGGRRFDCGGRDGALRLPEGVRRGHHLQRRHPGHPDSAVDRDGGVFGRHGNVGRQVVHGRGDPGAAAGPDADGRDLYRGAHQEAAGAAHGRAFASGWPARAVRSGACCCW